MASTIEDVQRNIFAEAERLNEEEEAKKLPAIIPTPNPTNDEGMASRNMHNKNLQSLADQNAPKDVINNYLRLAGLNQVNTSATNG